MNTIHKDHWSASADLEGSKAFLVAELIGRNRIHAIIRHTSRRGKSSEVDFLLILPGAPADGGVQILPASRSVSQVLDLPRSKRGAIICRETPEALVSRLAKNLFGDPQSIACEVL